MAAILFLKCRKMVLAWETMSRWQRTKNYFHARFQPNTPIYPLIFSIAGNVCLIGNGYFLVSTMWLRKTTPTWQNKKQSASITFYRTIPVNSGAPLLTCSFTLIGLRLRSVPCFDMALLATVECSERAFCLFLLHSRIRGIKIIISIPPVSARKRSR